MDDLEPNTIDWRRASDILAVTDPRNPDNAAAGSVDYMHMMGIAMLSYMWAKMTKVAQDKIDAGSDDQFYADKIITGKYFAARMVPQIDAHLAKLKSGAEPVMALSADRF